MNLGGDGMYEVEVDKDDKHRVKYAYISFKTMEAKDMVMRAYNRNNSWVKRVCKCCYSEEAREELDKLYILGTFPVLKEAVSPSDVIWENIGYSTGNRKVRCAINWLFVIVLLIISTWGTIVIMDEMAELANAYNLAVDCPPTNIIDGPNFKYKAWEDQRLPEETRYGLMHCYCFNQFTTNITWFYELSFNDVAMNNNPPDLTEQPAYCEDWLSYYGMQQGLTYGTSILTVGINLIMCQLIIFTISFEKRMTNNEETQQQYIRILVLTFVNIGLLVLLVNMDLTFGDGGYLGLPILNGEFGDLNSEWYGKIGVTISFSMVLSIFTTHISYFAFAAIPIAFRWLDNGCRSLEEMKKEDADKEAVDMHTKSLIQDDLNALWTGEEIYAFYVYAAVYSYYWVVMMFSTGLPLLYVCAFFFFLSFYWVYKLLLLKCYKRTEKFNESMAQQAVINFPIGLFIHLFFGSLMISNS